MNFAGRVWAGHNIVRFDCVRIREAFEKIGRAAPAPKGVIDSLALLTQRFGRRAGNMKVFLFLIKTSAYGIGSPTSLTFFFFYFQHIASFGS